MSKTLTVGSEDFEIPTQGETPEWGEETTDWMTAVTGSLTTVQGPNDILPRVRNISGTQTTLVDLPGLSFSNASVRSAEIDYDVRRTADYSESGKILAHYNGTKWIISHSSSGDADIFFDVTASGQFQYKVGAEITDDGTIKFKAKTIDV